MSAAALARMIEHAGVSVTLIESDEIGTWGWARPPSRRYAPSIPCLAWMRNDFVRHTQGSFKLGIEFVDWHRRGHRYIHPFGTTGQDFQGMRFHQFWLKLKQLEGGALGDITEYNLSAFAAQLNRFTRPRGGKDSVLARWGTRFISMPACTRATCASTAKCAVCGASKARSSTSFAQRRRLHSAPWSSRTDVRWTVSYSWIAAASGSLLAGPDVQGRFSGLEPLATVQPGGGDTVRRGPRRSCPTLAQRRMRRVWRWRIPLQHRTGNGYVYCSEYISDEDARAQLLAGSTARLAPRRAVLKFTAGCRRKFWV